VHGYAQGKALEPLAMDGFTATGLVKTASLNSIVTDSSPGMTAYVSGNKNNNNEEGVFPDDTVDAFDNPRVEYLSEYLHRTQGKQLGIVTTADVFDATPAGNAVHTSNRGAGTGIVDQFFDDRGLTGLRVLMGGGRKWFLPAGTPGVGAARAEWFRKAAAFAREIDRRFGPLIAQALAAGLPPCVGDRAADRAHVAHHLVADAAGQLGQRGDRLPHVGRGGHAGVRGRRADHDVAALQADALELGDAAEVDQAIDYPVRSCYTNRTE